VITVALANLLMAGVFAALHVRERRRIGERGGLDPRPEKNPDTAHRQPLSWFAFAFLLEMGRHLFSLTDVTPITFFAGGATFAAAVLTLVEGSFRFAGRRPSVVPRVLVGLLLAWQVVVFVYEPPFVVWHLPVSLFTTGMRLLVAIMLWRAGGPALGRSVAAAAMLLWSLHASTYPFLANVPSAAPWGFALSAFLGLVTAMGVVMAYFERARAEADASEARLRSVFDGASDGIAALDRDGTVVTANPALARLLGHDDPSALFGRSLAELTGAPSLAGDPTARGVETWRRRDGSTRLVSVSVSKRRAGDELDRVDVFARDVTEETRLKAALEQTRRVEAIGRLAAGVAHDFNNLLQVIHGALELAGRTRDDARRQKQIELALEAATRGSELTKQLLALGGKQAVDVRRLDLVELVRTLAEWIPRLLDESIELAVELPDGPLEVSADRAQLEQVLLNLATNARDAMPEGGTLRVAVRREGASHVALVVEDDGEGMDEATRARIFEPFFTTKERGRGTGLGLATVHGIATQQGWSIDVLSTPGEGARFTLRIPHAS
jgi:PAS domain S-box-containing protein